MAKDDYHVIVYQILSYLYDCLKRGIDPDPRQISCRSDFFRINERYWSYVMVSLLDYGFVDGCARVEVDNAEPTVGALDRARITPRGIEFLTDNSLMSKAKEFFRTAATIAPFVPGL